MYNCAANRMVEQYPLVAGNLVEDKLLSSSNESILTKFPIFEMSPYVLHTAIKCNISTPEVETKLKLFLEFANITYDYNHRNGLFLCSKVSPYFISLSFSIQLYLSQSISHNLTESTVIEFKHCKGDREEFLSLYQQCFNMTHNITDNISNISQPIPTLHQLQLIKNIHNPIRNNYQEAVKTVFLSTSLLSLQSSSFPLLPPSCISSSLLHPAVHLRATKSN